MKVSIIPSDGIVIKDGVGVKLPMTLPPNIHAIQWDGDKGKGEIEFNDGSFCKSLTDMDEYNSLLKDYEIEKIRISNISIPNGEKHGILVDSLLDALDETIDIKKDKIIELIAKAKQEG